MTTELSITCGDQRPDAMLMLASSQLFDVHSLLIIVGFIVLFGLIHAHNLSFPDNLKYIFKLYV